MVSADITCQQGTSTGETKAPPTEVPGVSIIIVTWNKEKDVARLLEQLRHIDYPEDKVEITVVDNDSTDDTVDIIELTYPWVRLIKNAENLGGAGGFNTGMRWVLENRPECEYMWLLDNDVLVDRSALAELVGVMENNPGAGICGSKILNIANHIEVIEVGGLIDYRIGDTKSNIPRRAQLNDKDAVFSVDYVAACSLLVRTELVTELGMLKENLFIYWDDMEWGMRFNAAGHRVLASNASVVYHPIWPKSTGDNSAIWRSYYRARNSLWFFNNYTPRITRQLLLARIVINSVALALSRCMSCDSRNSQSIIRGIKDFLHGMYGRKDIEIPVHDLDHYLSNRIVKGFCVFIRHVAFHEKAIHFISGLMRRFPQTKIVSIVPDETCFEWINLAGKNNVMAYKSPGKHPLSWTDKLRILKFLWKKPWDLLVTSPLSNWTVGIWGKDVARVDFEKEIVLSIEKMKTMTLFSIPYMAISFIFRVLLFPPAPEK
ncbi:MAG: glycosyltransferase family 2 protein [Thermodesulfobacteriota bacterium]|nr:glycosyltransferase family 2 protein [Thermodesulfobacteriota bacterium]